MDTARIAALLEPFLGPLADPPSEHALGPAQLEQISIYIDLLLRWNARINLTAIRHEEQIVTRHFGESLFMARNLFPAEPCRTEGREVERDAIGLERAIDPCLPSNPSPQPGGLSAPPAAPRVLDIGSGAGFPALPLKIWAPQIRLTLIEANHKKSAFLREVARALAFSHINVITGRAETISTLTDAPRAEVVTLRAVEHFETILPQAASFLRPHGTLALMIGVDQLPSLNTLTNMNWNPPVHIPQSRSRVLSSGVIT
ncbi:MAG: 16S rRNA (guanine(527)-N(7))-methyltransferase RsmG [Terriglobales bacterium]|jgi:16S rRNA (guanine527-N7)-methyltransferase